MCGRYATTRTPEDLAQIFAATIADETESLQADFNMAPTKRAPVIRSAIEGSSPTRTVTNATWGLVPVWAKDRSIGSRLINARSETAAQKPSFRRAYARRRAIVPADGYYEWYTPQAATTPGSRKPTKQPFYISRPDGAPLAMAGLYEFWRATDDDPWLMTFTILTTTAQDPLGHLHERMPLMVPSDDWDAWLDPRRQDPEEFAGLLEPADPDALQAWPVSRDVNNVRNNGPALRDPLPAEESLPLD